MLPKRLFIPNKTMPKVQQPGYGTDMRAIEIFNPINKIVAGSGITLVPSDGTGPQVEISSTGGSTGKVGALSVTYGPDDIEVAGSAYWLLGGALGVEGIAQGNDTAVNLFPGPSRTDFGGGWWTSVNIGESVNLLPIITTPAFTGVSTISVGFSLSAFVGDGSDLAFVTTVITSGTKAIGPSTTYQATLADIGGGGTSSGGFLVLTAGTGTSGNGWVYQGGGTDLYFCGISGTVEVGTGCVFT